MTNETVKKQILVVEDDEQSTRYLQVLLEHDYAICSATWAKTAWQILHESHIDLVLMDISLPGDENGLELTRRIRASKELHALPVIAVTAHAFPRDRENSLEAGCNDYISKPFERGLLLNTVRRYLA